MDKERNPSYFTYNLFSNYIPNINKRVCEYRRQGYTRIKHKLMSLLLCLLITILALYLVYKENTKYIKAAEALIITPPVDANTACLMQIGAIRQVLQRSSAWYNYLYFSSTHNQDLIKLIDTISDRYTRDTLAPVLFLYLEELIKNSLNNLDQDEILDAVKVYLMIFELEPFNQQYVQGWYLRHLKYINSEISILELEDVIGKIAPKMFINIPSEDLLNKILLTFNNHLIQIIYQRAKNALAHKKEIDARDLFSSILTKIFSEEMSTAKFPYFYTNNGYKDYLNYQTDTFKKLLKLAFFRQNMNLEIVQQSIQENNSLYVNGYSTKWNEYLNLISIRRVESLEDTLTVLQTIGANYSLIFNFFEQIDKIIFIQKSAAYIEEIKAALPINLEKTKGNNTVTEAIENFVIYYPLKQDTLKALETELINSIKELTGLIKPVLSSENFNEAAFRLIKKYESTKDTPLNKAEAFISSLPAGPLEKIYSELINSVKFFLYQHAYSYINENWESNIYEYYRDNIQSKYPFASKKYEDQLPLSDFTKFFKPNGIIDNFVVECLNIQGLNLNKEVVAFLNYAADIKNKWFNKEGKLQVKFSITPLRMDRGLRGVMLLITGKEVNFSLKEFNTYSFIWPPAIQNGDYVKIEFISDDNKKIGITYEGLWAWYKFLQFDRGDITGTINNDLISKTVVTTVLGKFEFISKLEADNGLTLLSNKNIIVPQQIININDYYHE